ncbi:hypothetical protein LUD75_01965 [Epilithonimonas sp. JDS]|uniref:FG-GAP repeat protein n=1 Tax=Epilithonimonas sp. JDS TaxID=2902797 RepID=UPI001E58F469|nr:FG-GAP repeat protein [Epilithonimonas sp. JDS]MCD9853454.1 hypothetical protein [Epilithonimonas sp. JDS]
MKTKSGIMTLAILVFSLSACNDVKSKKQKETLSEKNTMTANIKSPAQVTTPKISTAEAVKLATAQFDAYLPKILESHGANLDLQEPATGDFTGDGIDDVAIYFSLSPKGGGNALVGQGLTLYQNDGKRVKVIGGFEPDYLFSFKKISNGKIYVEKLEYAEEDGRCCPSIKTEHILTISGNKVY